MLKFEGTLRTVESKGAVIGLMGKGPLLAAACADMFLFNTLINEAMPVAVMGLRGHTGRGSKVTTEDKSAFELDNYMADFDSVLKELGARSINLFGYSYSGYFTTAYALANPGRVSSLILVEPALFTDAKELHRRAELAMSGDGVEALEAMLEYVSPELDAKARAASARAIREDWQSNYAFAGMFRARAERPIGEKALASLKMPVLLIGGTESHIGSMVKKAAEVIPYARVWWVKGANHLDLMSEKYADELAAVVKAFMKRV